MTISYFFTRAVIVFLCLCTVALEAAAQAYPTKPIQLLVPTAPGGGTDALGRALADALTASLKQQVIVINKAGASGSIASEMLVRSPADGYTLLVVQNGHSVNPAVFKKLPYDTFKDFTPIAPLGRSPMVLVAGSHTGVKTMKELTALGKRMPISMSFGASETSTRLATEMISDATGVPLIAVTYKGTGPVMSDLAGGHVNFSVTTIASTLAMRDSGKFNYVAVLASQRSSSLSEVPTLTEQGLPDIESSAWWGVVGPANMPKPLVQKLNEAIRTALGDPGLNKRLAGLSIEPWTASPEDFDKFIRKEVDLNLKLAKKAGIEPE